MTSIISIGCQGGGPEDGGIGDLKVHLFHALQRCLTSSHCQAIDEYALILRVDGSLDKFGPEGIDRIRFERKRRYVKADIQIPESVWKPKTEHEIKLYLSKVVRDGIAACVARLKRAKCSVQEPALYSEIDLAVKEFLKLPV